MRHLNDRRKDTCDWIRDVSGRSRADCPASSTEGGAGERKAAWRCLSDTGSRSRRPRWSGRLNQRARRPPVTASPWSRVRPRVPIPRCSPVPTGRPPHRVGPSVGPRGPGSCTGHVLPAVRCFDADVDVPNPRPMFMKMVTRSQKAKAHRLSKSCPARPARLQTRAPEAPSRL